LYKSFNIYSVNYASHIACDEQAFDLSMFCVREEPLLANDEQRATGVP